MLVWAFQGSRWVARQLISSYLPTSTLDNSDRKEAAPAAGAMRWTSTSMKFVTRSDSRLERVRGILGSAIRSSNNGDQRAPTRTTVTVVFVPSYMYASCVHVRAWKKIMAKRTIARWCYIPARRDKVEYGLDECCVAPFVDNVSCGVILLRSKYFM